MAKRREVREEEGEKRGVHFDNVPIFHAEVDAKWMHFSKFATALGNPRASHLFKTFHHQSTNHHFIYLYSLAKDSLHYHLMGIAIAEHLLD